MPSTSTTATDHPRSLFSILCANMRWTPDYLADIDRVEHEPLKDIDVLCARLDQMRLDGRRLVIYPDIDTDGLTSGTLGLAGFAELGFTVDLYVPDAAKGHGVYPEDVENIVISFPDVAAIITCDTGITSFDGVAKAHELGLPIFVTDHHKEYLAEDGSRLPADVVINPMRLDETYAHPSICGAFVMYQILEYYATTYRPDKLDAIRLLRLHAGIGTVADVMPVTHENRGVVRASLGLLKLLYVAPESVYDFTTRTTKITPGDVEDSVLMAIINAGRHHPAYVRAFRGVGALLNAYVARGSVRGLDSLDEGFYGFYVAPTINAIRRMEEDIALGFSAFLAEDPSVYATYLIGVNDRRKEAVKQLVEEMKQRPQPLAPYVYLTDANGGMLGLLANAMMHESGLPTLVVTKRAGGRFGGSGRAPMWYDFNSRINRAASTLGLDASAQGHEQAFGARIGSHDDMNRLVEFIHADAFNVAQQLREAGQVVDIPEADLILGDAPGCDAKLDEMEELLDLVDQLHGLKPFGHGFRQPVVDVVSDARRLKTRTMGSEDQHISIVNAEGLKMVAWNDSTTLRGLIEHLSRIPSETKVYLHALGRIERNEFRGEASVNHMVDVFYLQTIDPDGHTERITL